MKITLASDLEKALLRSIIEGLCSPELLAPDELSRNGKTVLKAVQYLSNHGAEFPIKPASVLLTSISQGADRDEIKDYLRSFKDLNIGRDAVAIARAARSKEILVNVINEAGEQLADGSLNLIKLQGIIEKGSSAQKIEVSPLAKEVGDKFGSPPKGYEIKSLPRLSELMNGVFGLWVIGGEPGLGKSTMAWQISLDLGDRIPVLYYDIDGTGREYFVDRTRQIAEGSIQKFKKLTSKIYLRNNIRFLDTDLMSVKPPALIVVDSGQTLPTSIAHRRTSLDKWITDLKEISNRGYAVLIVSEVGRAFYGKTGFGSYKETGSFEYGGATCLQLSGDPEDSDQPIGVCVLKSRHTSAKGHVLDLVRHPKKIWVFVEQDAVEEDYEREDLL